jgi:hypothetical protein
MATAQRVTRREICPTHGIEFGQERIPDVPGKSSSYWIPAVCRECEAQLRRDEQATKEIAAQVEEIRSEAESRIAADSEYEEKIRTAADADLAEEVQKEVARFCSERRPQWETHHCDLAWNEIVRQIEAEKKEGIISRLRGEESKHAAD